MRVVIIVVLLIIIAAVSATAYWLSIDHEPLATGADATKPSDKNVESIVIEFPYPSNNNKVVLKEKADIEAFWDAAFSEPPRLDTAWEGWKHEHSTGFEDSGGLIDITTYDAEGEPIQWMALTGENLLFTRFNFIQIRYDHVRKEGETRYFPINDTGAAWLSDILKNRSAEDALPLAGKDATDGI